MFEITHFSQDQGADGLLAGQRIKFPLPVSELVFMETIHLAAKLTGIVPELYLRPKANDSAHRFDRVHQ